MTGSRLHGSDHSTSVHGRSLYQGLLEALAQGMGAAKGYLADHGPRTAALAHALGVRIGLDERELAELFFAALLADVGMIGLVEEAWEEPVLVLPHDLRGEVHSHPDRSAEAASGIPYLTGTQRTIRHHHEWWDGSGYPDGLSGEAIPIAARILRLADTITALAGDRPQRRGLGPEEISGAILAGIGSEFDPYLGRLWLELSAAKRVPEFQAGSYRELRGRAIQALVPPQVPHSASEVLLNLFATLVDAKDPYTAGHSRRVAQLAEHLATVLGFDWEVREQARRAGYLHDLGKLAVPTRLLRKPGGLTEAEASRVRQHAGDGARLLAGIPALRIFAPACRHHHERWDGGGYPEGISGERIPLLARMLTVCDAYDAMTSARAYRGALSHREAVSEIEFGVAGHFAPQEADAFLAIPEGFFRELAETAAASPPGGFVERHPPPG